MKKAIPVGISAIQAEVEGSEDSSRSEDEGTEHEAAKKRIAEEYQNRIDSGAVAFASSSDLEEPPTSVSTVVQIEESHTPMELPEPPETDPPHERGPTKGSTDSWNGECQTRGCWRGTTLGERHCCSRCFATLGRQHSL